MQHRSLARIELWTLWFGGKLTLTIMPSGRPHQFFCALLPSPSKKSTLCADAASSQPGAVVTKCQTWENQISNTNGENLFHFTILHPTALCNVTYRHQQHAQAYSVLTLSLWERSTYEEGMWVVLYQDNFDSNQEDNCMIYNYVLATYSRGLQQGSSYLAAKIIWHQFTYLCSLSMCKSRPGALGNLQCRFSQGDCPWAIILT